ncbi:MAG: metal-binding protein [Betaproteobacteria bacterium HGW-Betaproteobacteria-12]|nr:MAG: metal-binding protein [Betaproteobacteria bacterium HGW-Betaproteobacteria-12]
MAKPIAVLLTLFALGAVAILPVGAAGVVDVYKSPYCGCCGKWVEHLRKAGFAVQTHDVNDVPAARQRLGSCHTAKLAGYVVEGHVPAADIQRLLKEKPKAIGLAVPSMPPGSPGMESPKPVPYNTLLVRTGDEITVFAKH